MVAFAQSQLARPVPSFKCPLGASPGPVLGRKHNTLGDGLDKREKVGSRFLLQIEAPMHFKV
jgi:hypothetical protein